MIVAIGFYWSFAQEYFHSCSIVVVRSGFL